MSDGLSMIRGDTTIIDVVVALDGAPVIVEGDVRFTAKRARTDADEDAVITKTVGDGVEITAPLVGELSITIDPEDTEGLERGAFLWWDLQLDDGATTLTVADGTLDIRPDVSRTAP